MAHVFDIRLNPLSALDLVEHLKRVGWRHPLAVADENRWGEGRPVHVAVPRPARTCACAVLDAVHLIAARAPEHQAVVRRVAQDFREQAHAGLFASSCRRSLSRNPSKGHILSIARSRAILRPISALKLSGDTQADSPVTVKPLRSTRTQKVSKPRAGISE